MYETYIKDLMNEIDKKGADSLRILPKTVRTLDNVERVVDSICRNIEILSEIVVDVCVCAISG